MGPARDRRYDMRQFRDRRYICRNRWV